MCVTLLIGLHPYLNQTNLFWTEHFCKFQAVVEFGFKAGASWLKPPGVHLVILLRPGPSPSPGPGPSTENLIVTLLRTLLSLGLWRFTG